MNTLSVREHCNRREQDWACVAIPLGDCAVQGLSTLIWRPLAPYAQAVKHPKHGQESFRPDS